MNRPNVIIILADDLGFSDIEPFGGEIDTPSLNKLVDRGIRMSSFYVTPRCSPSRAALLTGHHPHSVGIGVLTSDNRPNGYPGSLSTDAPTLAERLKQQGYSTALFGKWHLASETTTPSETWPTRRGFDEFRGIMPGASTYYEPPLMQGEDRLPDSALPEDFYFTEDITSSAVDFIRRNAATDDPFFLFLTYTAPHWPLHAAEADIAKYRQRYAAGWTETRAARIRRLADSGLVGANDRLSTAQDLPEWPEEDRDWQIERMAVYAAQVESLDKGVGRVLEALSETGVQDDTLVLFLSDNGGCAEELPPGTTAFNPLVCPRTTRSGEKIVIGNDPTVMPGPSTTYQSYGVEWATVSNTPFRKWKRWVHEGGISTPFIAAWPNGGIPAGGTISHTPGHIIDIVPTVLETLDVPSDTSGQSLLKTWQNPDLEGEDRSFYWEHTGNAAVRRGRYKLVREWESEWELYDILTDRLESHDLAAEQPKLVEELVEDYESWAAVHAVIPWQDVLADHVARGIAPARAIG